MIGNNTVWGLTQRYWVWGCNQLPAYSFPLSFIKHLLNIYYVPAPAIGTRDASVIKMDSASAHKQCIFLEETDKLSGGDISVWQNQRQWVAVRSPQDLDLEVCRWKRLQKSHLQEMTSNQRAEGWQLLAGGLSEITISLCPWASVSYL